MLPHLIVTILFSRNLIVALGSVPSRFFVFHWFLVEVFFNFYQHFFRWYISSFLPPRFPDHRKIFAFASIFVCLGYGKVSQSSTAFLSATQPYFKEILSNLVVEILLWNRKNSSGTKSSLPVSSP